MSTSPAAATAVPDIITLGCRLNIAESETIRALIGNGDTVVINSCAVTQAAVRDTRSMIRRVRRDRPQAEIIVTGCAAQIDPAGFAAMPEVNRVIGNADKLTPQAWEGNDRIVLGDIMQARDTAPHLAAVFASHARAFVEVQMVATIAAPSASSRSAEATAAPCQQVV